MLEYSSIWKIVSEPFSIRYQFSVEVAKRLPVFLYYQKHAGQSLLLNLIQHNQM
jgi:hypothetical protein